MEEIVSQIWIGDIEDVSEAETGHFDYVVSVCQDAREDNVGCEYEHFKLADDRQSEKEWGGSADYEDFQKATRRVEELVEEGNTVLVHCHKGRNRSVAVVCAVIAFLISDFSFNDALDLAMRKRPVVNPNSLMSSYAKKYIEERELENYEERVDEIIQEQRDILDRLE